MNVKKLTPIQIRRITREQRRAIRYGERLTRFHLEMLFSGAVLVYLNTDQSCRVFRITRRGRIVEG